MPVTDRVRLHNRQPRGLSPKDSWGLIAAGLLFMACSIPVLLLWVGVITPEQLRPSRHVRSPYPFFSVFALTGIVLIRQGVMKQLRSPERKRRSHPGWPPWMTDYPWHAEGETASRLREGLWGLFGGAVFFGCVAWIQWGLTVPGLKTPVPMLAGLGFTYLIAAACLVLPIYRIFQFLRYGRTRISYSSFPLPLGETITLRIEMPRRIASEQIKVTLRHIEEYRQMVKDQSGDSKVEDRIEQMYADVTMAPVEALPLGGIAATARFELPMGDYETALAAEKPRYWEVEFLAETPGVDFSITFLLPVFSAATGEVQRLA